MKKTILTLVMMLTMAIAATAVPIIKVTPVVKATPAKNQTNVEFKGDSIVVTDGDESVTVTGIPELQKVRDKINAALDDTLAAGSESAVEIVGCDGDLSPEDIKYMSDHWGKVVENIVKYSILGLLALVLLVLLFRYLNRRNKYRVMERAIENNYPLNDLSFTDAKRSAIYVQQPVVTAAAPQQPGQVPVGAPIQDQTPDNPIVVSGVFNWRALMPAIRVLGWGMFLLLFGIFVAGGNDPFTIIGIALMFVGLIKGFILYKEQQSLQEAMKRAQQTQRSEPMREGIPVPPPLDEDYKEDDSNNYQPY